MVLALRNRLLSTLFLMNVACTPKPAEPENDAPKRSEPSSSAPAAVEAPSDLDPVPGVREFPLPTGPGSFAPSVATAGDMLYLAWYERLADGEVALRFARHDGNAWSPADTLVSSATLGFDARLPPSVGVIGELTVFVGWPERMPSGQTAFRLSRSRGAGKRWEPPVTVFETAAMVPVPPQIVGAGKRRGLLAWLASDGDETSVRRTTLPESGALDAIGAAATAGGRSVCGCCDFAATDSASGPLLVYRGDAADRLVLETPAAHHEVARVAPEVSCGRRYVDTDVDGSTIAVAWSDATDEAGVCVSFSASPKSWKGCAGLGRRDQQPVGDLVLLDAESAAVTLTDVVATGTSELVVQAIRRDGVVGAARRVSRTPDCPVDACGRPRTVAFDGRLAWFWVDPGVQGKSMVRAAIAPVDALR